MEAVARQRDRAAFAELFRYFAPRINGWLQRQGLDATSAEELSQETMLLVWQKAALFDPGRATVAAWIFTIARNRRVDVFRQQSRTNDSLMASMPEEAAPPDQALETGQEEARVRLALAQLPDEQAAVVRATFFAEKAQTEIKDAFNIPLGTVKSRLRLALQRLRVSLEDLR